MVIHQTPTSTAALNDPLTVLTLGRQGTPGQAYGAAASFRLSRYEASGVDSRTRLDLTMSHNSFDLNSNTIMTLYSRGEMSLGRITEAYGSTGWNSNIVLNSSGKSAIAFHHSAHSISQLNYQSGTFQFKMQNGNTEGGVNLSVRGADNVYESAALIGLLLVPQDQLTQD